MRCDENTTPNEFTPTHPDIEKRLSLSQAARIAPGTPSPNCVWRWCRRGVLARTGERVRLHHVRVGGKLFTTAVWIDEFGDRLAAADADYFELRNTERASTDQVSASRQQPPRGTGRKAAFDVDMKDRDRVRAELESEGL